MFEIATSRRQLLRKWAGLVLPLTISQAVGQHIPSSESEIPSGFLPMRLFKEFKFAQLLDTSPDGGKLCLYFTRNPTRSFVWQGGWEERTTPVRDGEDALRVIDRDTWKLTYATRLPALPFWTSFFPDNKTLYVGIPAVASGGTEHLVIDLRNGIIQKRLDPLNQNGLNFSYIALGDGLLLGCGRSFKANRTEILTKVELPSYNEIRRVPFAEGRSASTGMTETSVRTSVNRNKLVYTVDNAVVCRSTEHLATLWTRKTEADLVLWQTAISADGGLVAASNSNNVTGQGRTCHVWIYSGVDGATVAQIPVDGTEGMAISPDKTLLAVGQSIALHGRKSGTQPTVLLFEIASGKKLATLIQDQFYGGGGEFLHARFGFNGIQFSLDGKCLITSGLHTKLWEIA